jgi:hypothetical protein
MLSTAQQAVRLVLQQQTWLNKLPQGFLVGYASGYLSWIPGLHWFMCRQGSAGMALTESARASWRDLQGNNKAHLFVVMVIVFFVLIAMLIAHQVHTP